MKIKALFLSTLFIAVLSFGATAQGERTTKVSIDTENSSIHWVGKKVTGSHEGGISLSAGELQFAGTDLAGGSFTIDMTSITVEDISNEGQNAKLVKHLKNEDFFDVTKHKSATLEITSITKTETKEASGKSKATILYNVISSVTIKGITKEVTFPVTVNYYGAAGVKAEATIIIDRTEFGIHYGADKSLGDRMINKNFELVVAIAAAI